MFNKVRTIVITGPESTGKTELSKALSKHYGTKWEPELAREYVEKLGHKYTFEDVETIARMQVENIRNNKKSNLPFIIYDTGLIITKVWFEVVYNHVPQWFLQALEDHKPDLYLVCNTDLPWIADNVRENGGEMREKLLAIYLDNIKQIGIPYHMVNGVGAQREQKAIQIVDSWLLSIR